MEMVKMSESDKEAWTYARAYEHFKNLCTEIDKLNLPFETNMEIKEHLTAIYGTLFKPKLQQKAISRMG
jgi:hypothetical protein